eukprot:1193046-Prorocentrum_minimum.AAC.2
MQGPSRRPGILHVCSRSSSVTFQHIHLGGPLVSSTFSFRAPKTEHPVLLTDMNYKLPLGPGIAGCITHDRSDGFVPLPMCAPVATAQCPVPKLKAWFLGEGPACVGFVRRRDFEYAVVPRAGAPLLFALPRDARGHATSINLAARESHLQERMSDKYHPDAKGVG